MFKIIMKVIVIHQYKKCLILKKMMILKILINNKSINKKINILLIKKYQITLLVKSQAKLKANSKIQKKEKFKHKQTQTTEITLLKKNKSRQFKEC